MHNKTLVKLSNWYDECFVSSMPILSPLSAGKAMSVNPKVLIAHAWMWFLGENHDESCDCDVCRYRRDTTNVDQVLAQRESTSLVFANLREEIRSRFDTSADESISSDEAAYWMQWMADNFPDSVKGVGNVSLHRMLDGLPSERLGEVLLGHAIDYCPSLNLSNSEYGWLWDAMASTEGDPTATQELLLTVASMQYAGSET